MKIVESITYVVVVVFALGCATTRTHNEEDDGDSSLEQKDGKDDISGESFSKKDGSSDNDSGLFPDGSREHTGSGGDTSPLTNDASGSEGGGSGSNGIYDSSTDQNTNDSSSDSGITDNPDPNPDESSNFGKLASLRS